MYSVTGEDKLTVMITLILKSSLIFAVVAGKEEGLYETGYPEMVLEAFYIRRQELVPPARFPWCSKWQK